MSRVFRAATVTIGLVLLGAAPSFAQVQTVPTTPPATAAPDTTTPPVTPAASADPKALLGQMADAYKALNSFSGTVTTQSVINGKPVPQMSTFSIAFQKPNKALATDSDGAKLVSDGINIYASSSRDKKYVKNPIPAGADAITALLSQVGGRSLLVGVIADPSLVSHFFADPTLKSLTVGAPTIVGDTPVDTIVAVLTPVPGATETVTLALGKDDHLLRQVSFDARRLAHSDVLVQSLLRTETFSNIQINPALPASTFAFVPPPGFKKFIPPAQPAEYDPRLKPGASPFPITAKDLSGHPVSLSQYKGKVVLLDFWATWCGPCVGEMPNVISAYHQYHAQGFDILGISLDQSRASLVAFIRENKMPWPQVFDGKFWSSAVPRQFGVQAIPFGLLIGRDGKIAAVGARGPELQAAIQVALAKKQ